MLREKRVPRIGHDTDASGLEVCLEQVTDFRKIAEHGVFSTPAVIVDGKIKSVGKVPQKEEILTWLGK